MKLVAEGQDYMFTTLPGELGLRGKPAWWPLPMLGLCGLLVGLSLRYLPRAGGHHPADGFKAGGAVAATCGRSVCPEVAASCVFFPRARPEQGHSLIRA